MATSFSRTPTKNLLENGPFGMLMGMNPARIDYLLRVLEGERGEDLRGTRVLDVGCGIGLLSEPLARQGCHVAGIDSTDTSLALARQRATDAGLSIDYRTGRSEALPFDDGSFDVVICCDVLEHVDDLEQSLSESSRVLKPNGIYIYATLNRTFESWLLAIKFLQDWPFSRLLPDDLHRWRLFITPTELCSLMAARGLKNRELFGLRPTNSPLKILRALFACKRGKLTSCGFGSQLTMRLSRNARVQYLGHAVKV